MTDLDGQSGLADPGGQMERTPRIGGDDDRRLQVGQRRQLLAQERVRHDGLLEQIGARRPAAAIVAGQGSHLQRGDTGQQTIDRGIATEQVAMRARLVDQHAPGQRMECERHRPGGPIQKLAEFPRIVQRGFLAQFRNAGAGEPDQHTTGMNPRAVRPARVGLGGIAVMPQQRAAASRLGRYPHPQSKPFAHLDRGRDRRALRAGAHAADEQIQLGGGRIQRSDPPRRQPHGGRETMRGPQPSEPGQRRDFGDARQSAPTVDPGQASQRPGDARIRQTGQPAAPQHSPPCGQGLDPERLGAIGKASVGDQRGTNGFAGAAGQTAIQMSGQGVRQLQIPRQPALDQRDSPARRIGLVARHAIGRATWQAQAALDALISESKQFLRGWVRLQNFRYG